MRAKTVSLYHCGKGSVKLSSLRTGSRDALRGRESQSGEDCRICQSVRLSRPLDCTEAQCPVRALREACEGETVGRAEARRFRQEG